jgi:hypothetical protein
LQEALPGIFETIAACDVAITVFPRVSDICDTFRVVGIELCVVFPIGELTQPLFARARLPKFVREDCY